MLTYEAIEVHLSYLRPAVEALDQKLDQANKDRAAGDAVLAEKIDKTNEKIDKTNEKIDQTSKELTDRISKIQGSLDGLKWFIGSIALILSGLSIAHNLDWI